MPVGDVDAVAAADEAARLGADEAGERPWLHQMALGKVGRLVGRQVRFAGILLGEIPHGSHLFHSNRLKQETKLLL